jgi:hypothetical protein
LACDSDSHVYHRVLLHAAGGFTSSLKDFFARKIRRLRPCSNPRSWVPEASMLTTRPPEPRSVGIATGSGLDGPGIESLWGLDFPHLSRPGLLPTQSASCTMGTGSFPGVESGRGVTLTPHPLLVPWYKKQSRAIPLFSLRAFVACKKGETCLFLYKETKQFCHEDSNLKNSAV